MPRMFQVSSQERRVAPTTPPSPTDQHICPFPAPRELLWAAKPLSTLRCQAQGVAHALIVPKFPSISILKRQNSSTENQKPSLPTPSLGNATVLAELASMGENSLL